MTQMSQELLIIGNLNSLENVVNLKDMILNKQNQPFKIFLNQPSYPSLGSAIYIYMMMMMMGWIKGNKDDDNC